MTSEATPPVPRQDLARVVQHLATYLDHQREDGVEALAVDRAVLQQVGQPPAMAAPQPAPAPQGDRVTSLDRIAQHVNQCTACPLSKTRNKTVPGQGNPSPEIVFIGEGPGADEDRKGLAFVGRAGQLLTKIIEAMGLTRDEVWIGNIVKCRPPDNRTPLPEEMEACMPFLKEQLALLRPKVIVCLGATAVKGLLQTGTGITKLRGSWMTFEGIDVMPTYHPAYLLRNAKGAKRAVWEDMQEVLRRLGRPIPERGK
jgi:DNA polymerase